MFFSYNLLVSKNSHFAIIWKYMHDRHGVFKVSRRELLSIDIAKACDDLQNHIPTGVLLKSELRNKMSLYLLGQLSYGITLVFKAHVDYFINDLEMAIKSFARFPEEQKREKTPRKSTGRKRKLTELDGMVEAVMAVPRGMEPEELEEDDDVGTKRRRTSAVRKATKLNLADPSAYVDQQLPVRDFNDQSLLMDEASRLDDMFIDQTAQPALPPPDWVTGQPDSLQLGEPMEAVRPGSQQKVSILSLLMGDETLINEVDQPVPVTASLSVLQPPVEEIGLPVEMPRVPIYKNRSTDEPPPVNVVSDSTDFLQLDSLPEIVQPPRANRRRKRLLVDEQIEMRNEEIEENIRNYSDLVRNLDDVRRECMRPVLPTVAQLLSPRPYHIKGLNPELYSLFDSVRPVIRDQPMTFKEAQAMTIDDFLKRRLNIDDDDDPYEMGTLMQQRTDETSGVADDEQRRTELRGKEKVSMSDALVETMDMEHRQSSVLEEEAMRRDTGEGGRRLTDISFPRVLPENEQIAADLDQTQPPQVEEIVADTELMQESVMTREHTQADAWDEQTVDDNTRELYSRINRGGVVSFEELLRSDSFGETYRSPITREFVARKFFALLNLLKHRKIKVRQRKTYGEILIRALPTLGNDGGDEHPSFVE